MNYNDLFRVGRAENTAVDILSWERRGESPAGLRDEAVSHPPGRAPARDRTRMSGRSGLQVRAANAADASGVSFLMAAAGHPVPAAAIEPRLEAFRHERGLVLIAERWGPPSGLVVLAWLPTLGSDGQVAQVETLLVDPEERRRGVGRLLLKAGAQAARAAGCATLRIAAPAVADPSLRAFCEATGFGEAGTLSERALRKRP